MLHELRKRCDEFDVLHFHVDLVHFPFFEQIAAQTVTTLHGRLDLKDLPEAYARWRDYPLVSISDDQRAPLPEANWLATIPHGLAESIYTFNPAPTQPAYLAFLGRISPEKRPDRAIAIAKRSGMRLKIAAKVDAADAAYFHEVIEPLLDHPLVEFVGEIGDSEKSAFLGNAQALLFPIDWPEPFGLVMIEAMACGTPVIAWRCGSVPEIVDHGETGFIVATEDEAVAALTRLQLIDRRRVRDVFEQRFTATVMARNYLRLYWRLCGGINHAASTNGIGEGVRCVDGLPGLLVQPVGHDLAGPLEARLRRSHKMAREPAPSASLLNDAEHYQATYDDAELAEQGAQGACAQGRGKAMNSIIYLVGLVVVVLFILSVLGLR